MTAVASRWVSKTEKTEYNARLFVQEGDTETAAHDLIWNALTALADEIYADWSRNKHNTNVDVQVKTQGNWESVPVQFNREAIK